MNERTTLKDVILLCKGWRDEEKYPTIRSALKAYYQQYCSSDIEYDNWTHALLHIVLKQAMEELILRYPDRARGFVTIALFIHSCGETDENDSYYDVLFDRIVGYFAAMQIRGDGIVEIDTDAYFCRDDNSEKQLVKDIIE